MQDVGHVDSIGSADTESIVYPCLIVEGVKLLQQLELFLLEGGCKSDTLVVPMYGVKSNGNRKYVGEILLSASQILRMWYLGLKPVYYSSDVEFTDFSQTSHIIGICTNKGLR